MTPSKYFFLCIASRFGYLKKNVRLAQAATESNLLKEAETYLGEAIWRDAENVEALSMEYWNLRKLTQEREAVSREIQQLQGKFAASHEQPGTDQTTPSASHHDLTTERNDILSQLEKLTQDRDRIIANAHDVRRIYDGLKVKLDVLRKEGDSLPEIHKTSVRLSEIRDEFDALKQSRDLIAHDIATANARIREIDACIGDRKKINQSTSNAASQLIGDANQRISAKQAQLNALNTQIRQLHGDIGRYVSLNIATDPECKKSGKSQRGLIEVMVALRKSIQFNWKLAERR